MAASCLDGRQQTRTVWEASGGEGRKLVMPGEAGGAGWEGEGVGGVVQMRSAGCGVFGVGWMGRIQGKMVKKGLGEAGRGIVRGVGELCKTGHWMPSCG